jgi:hypothetical protein
MQLVQAHEVIQSNDLVYLPGRVNYQYGSFLSDNGNGFVPAYIRLKAWVGKTLADYENANEKDSTGRIKFPVIIIRDDSDALLELQNHQDVEMSNKRIMQMKKELYSS